jgi:hypothetical protein
LYLSCECFSLQCHDLFQMSERLIKSLLLSFRSRLILARFPVVLALYAALFGGGFFENVTSHGD